MTPEVGNMSLVCKKSMVQLGMVAHTFYTSIQEVGAGAGGSLLVQAQPGLHNKFQDSQSYTDKPCLKQDNSMPAHTCTFILLDFILFDET